MVLPETILFLLFPSPPAFIPTALPFVALFLEVMLLFKILIPKIGKKAEFKIENNSSRQVFYKKIREIMKKLK